MKSSSIAPCLLLASTTLWFGQARAETTPRPITLTDIHIVSQVDGTGDIADDKPKRALADVGVTMHAVLEARRGRDRLFYSDVSPVRIRGHEHQALPLAEAPGGFLVWYKVEPAIDWLSNTETGSFRYETITYQPVMVDDWLFQGTVTADVTPSLTPDRGHGVGTMRYQLVFYSSIQRLTTPGAEARRTRSSGGLDDSVHRVSLRRDDSYLGMMTEMFGQPYIWASGGSKPRSHQSERLEGSDCADLMVYGARRKGYDIPYTWTGGMHEYTRELAAGSPREDGVYIDDNGDPIAFTRPGDMLLFPRHVGALVEDRGALGLLDNRDIMMHTYFATPREQPVIETPYGGAPIKLVRWKRALD